MRSLRFSDERSRKQKPQAPISKRLTGPQEAVSHIVRVVIAIVRFKGRKKISATMGWWAV